MLATKNITVLQTIYHFTLPNSTCVGNTLEYKYKYELITYLYKYEIYILWIDEKFLSKLCANC